MKGVCQGACKVIRETAVALNKLARPYLTVLITTVYNVILARAALKGELPWRDYIMAVGPMNAMIVGFWFGEKAALKVPGEQDAKS